MDFDLTEEQAALKETVIRFVQNEIAPIAEADDETETFRPEIIKKMGQLGIAGITTPEEYGGAEMGYETFIVVLEEIAKGSASYAVTLSVQGLPQICINKFGDAAQKEKYLPRLAAAELLGGFALTEPSAGSDAGSLRSTARRDGDAYVINGSKIFITTGGYCDVYIVFARTGGEGPKGVSAFIVQGDDPGLRIGKKEKKMGMRASPTTELVFEDLRVPADRLLGGEGDGFKVAMTALDSGRITIASIAVGIAQAALEEAVRYTKGREQFGKPVSAFQGVQFMLADMAARVEAGRLLAQKAACLRDRGRPHTYVASMAKLTATDAAMSVTTDAVQLHGGYGYVKEYPVERYMRDAKVTQIFEGTNQIQRMVVARELMKLF